MTPILIRSFLAALTLASVGLPSAFAQTTERVSVDSLGVQGNLFSEDSSISANGHHVAFASNAFNLVTGDSNNNSDVFVYDLQTSQTTRVSVDSAGVQGGKDSWNPSISADGRYVAFASFAPRLVAGDTNGIHDIFVHDRQTGQTTRVSVDSAGVQGNNGCDEPAISADGRYVAFSSHADNLVPGDTNTRSDVFVHDRQTGQTSRVSVDSLGLQGNNNSDDPAISSDGRYVAFGSLATNLVPGDTNVCSDVFVHDRGATGPTLARVGNCPGAITLTMTGATAGGDVVFACGPAGTFVRPAPPCLGLVLNVTPPALTAVRTADGLGTAVFQFHASLALCGRSLQGVDVASCNASNVIVL